MIRCGRIGDLGRLGWGNSWAPQLSDHGEAADFVFEPVDPITAGEVEQLDDQRDVEPMLGPLQEFGRFRVQTISV